MPDIYCGNNSRDTRLLSGEQVLGTRYRCLKKGIGKGLHLPIDPNYTGEYLPIDNRKIYCGNQNTLPNGYDSMGNLPQCLQKGVGIGKLKAYDGYSPPNFNDGYSPRIGYSSYKFILLYVILSIIILLSLCTIKPYFIMKKDTNNNKSIDFLLLFRYFIVIITMLAIIMIIMYYTLL